MSMNTWLAEMKESERLAEIGGVPYRRPRDSYTSEYAVD